MSDQQIDLLTVIKRLTVEQKEAARTAAQEVVKQRLGDPPKWHQYLSAESRGGQSGDAYPWPVQLLISAISLLVMAAAFVASSLRIYDVAHSRLLTQLSDPDGAHIGALAITVLAETSIIVFMLGMSAARGRTQIAILLTFAIGSSLLAISGNFTAAMPAEPSQYVFDWLEAGLPPIITIGVGYVLEQQLMRFIQTLNAALSAHAVDLKQYNDAKTDPEHHPRWLGIYARKLRDAITSANTHRASILKGLDNQGWTPLIRRELDDDQWDQWLLSGNSLDPQQTSTNAVRGSLKAARQSANSLPTTNAVSSLEQISLTNSEQISANGYNKDMEAVEFVEDWLRQHPEYIDPKTISLDRLVEQIRSDTHRNVKRSSVYKARKQVIKEGPVNASGGD